MGIREEARNWPAKTVYWSSAVEQELIRLGYRKTLTPVPGGRYPNGAVFLWKLAGDTISHSTVQWRGGQIEMSNHSRIGSGPVARSGKFQYRLKVVFVPAAPKVCAVSDHEITGIPRGNWNCHGWILFVVKRCFH